MNSFENMKKMDTYDLLLRLTIILLVFLAVFSAFQIYRKSSSVRQAIALTVTKKPETFTELYFENHQKLPTEIAPDALTSFKFTIHNLENQDLPYSYYVYIERNGKKTGIKSGKIFIKNNESATIPVTFSYPFVDRYRVVVDLENKNDQSVDFWVN